MFGLHMGRMGGSGQIGASAPLWTPAQINFTTGLWIKAAPFSNAYQDSAGTTLVTAVEQSVGLVLDKSKVAGPELVAGSAVASNGNGTVSTAGNIISITCTVPGVFGAKVPLSAASNISRYQAKATILSTPGRSTYFSVSGSSDYLFGIATGTASWFAAVPAAGTAGFLYLVFAGGQVGDVITVSASSLSVKEFPGNHMTQATSTARPLTKSDSGIINYKFDGIDDGLSTGAATFGSDMDCFMLVRRDSAAQVVLAYQTAGGANYLGAMDATAGTASSGAGTPTYAVNGVDVAGGTATTRTQLAAAIPTGQWVVVEIRNANLSAWAALGIGAFASYPLNGATPEYIACPAQTPEIRTKIRQYLGAQAGLTL